MPNGMKGLKIRDSLNQIDERLESIEQVLAPDIVRDALSYRKLKSLLGKVSVSVKTVSTPFDDSGAPYARISFAVDNEEIHFDEDGEEIVNEAVKAMCLLNILTLEDQMRIDDACAYCSEEIKRGVDKQTDQE